MSQLIQLLLSQWELDHPTFDFGEMPDCVQSGISTLCDLEVLRDAPDAAAWTCAECGFRSQIQFIVDRAGIAHAFSCCPDCGPNKINPRFLKRWAIDTKKLLEVLFGESTLSIQERKTSYLWQIGRAIWAGRSRDIWFIRSFRSSNASLIAGVLESWPKAIIFTPTATMADKIRAEISNLVISLDEVVTIRATEFHLDSRCIESRIQDREQSPKTKKAVSPKRAIRLANGEKIKDELIAHIITARDHAYFTKETTGEAVLLPRPLQKDLAKRLDLHVSAVSRCLNEKDNYVLQRLWNMANSLDEVMKYVTPTKRKRKS